MINTDSLELTIKEKLISCYEKLNNLSNFNLIEALRYINSSEWSNINQQTYMILNSVGTACESYIGVNYTAKWYERNLKIFANIQRLCDIYRRVFILIGAGHLKLLKDFIQCTKNIKLIDTDEYLK